MKYIIVKCVFCQAQCVGIDQRIALYKSYLLLLLLLVDTHTREIDVKPDKTNKQILLLFLNIFVKKIFIVIIIIIIIIITCVKYQPALHNPPSNGTQLV